MKTVLVTGAYGFLGRHAAVLFKKRNWRVLGLGHGHWGFEHPEEFGIDKWIEADVDYYTLLKVEEDLNCIVHCAGGSSVGYSVQYPLRDFNRTVSASVSVLEYIRLHQTRAQFVYPSSAAVYGSKKNRPIPETDALSPVSPYGFHKRMVEELCKAYSSNYGVSCGIIRFFSVCGPGLKKQLLWDACNKLAGGESRVEFFGTGDETRDWIHVRDAAKLILCMAESSEEFEIVNGGTGKALTIREVLETLGARFSQDVAIGFNGESREGDPKHYWADIARARAKGWRPAITLEDGIREYVEWFRQQRQD